MRAAPASLLALSVTLAGCQAFPAGPQRLALDVAVPCTLSQEDFRILRGRTDALVRQERAALQQSLELVEAAIALGGDAFGGAARAVRQTLIDRSNANLKLVLEEQADIACGFLPADRPLPPTPPRTERGVRV